MRGRPPGIPKTKWHIAIPQGVAAKVDLLLYDPLMGRALHGARSGLISKLLNDWIKRKQGKESEQNGK